MTGAKDTENHDLIQGMYFIKGKTLNVLYDSGAKTDSFAIIVFNILICRPLF